MEVDVESAEIKFYTIDDEEAEDQIWERKRKSRQKSINDAPTITINTKQSKQENNDPVLQKVYQWLKSNEKPVQIDPTIASNSYLLVCYKIFNQLYVNHDIKINHIVYPNILDSNPNQKDKKCLHLNFFM